MTVPWPIQHFYWVLGALVAGAVVVFELICLRLKSHHVAVWESLGRPTVPFVKDRDLRPLRAFLGNRAFRGLSDPTLSRLSWLAIAVKWALALWVGALFVSMLWP